jgi:signal recognition particle subunit SEC65
MNLANNDTISDALNMTPLIIDDNIPIEGEIQQNDRNARADFEFARSNLYDIIENGKNALELLSQIASQSQHPRAFEVLSGLIKTIADANKDLMLLQKNIKELKEPEIHTHNKTINQSIFVGSTAELQKMIKNISKE